MARTAKNKSQTSTIEVKKASDVITTLNLLIENGMYKKVNRTLSKKTQAQLVSYGPWLIAVILLIGMPELLIFAKDSQFVGFSSFFTEILFNQSSWVLLLVALANCLLLADALSDLFNKKRRGWNRIYIALLINFAYAFSQLAQNLTQPAAPLISTICIGFFLFVLFDIKKYYK